MRRVLAFLFLLLPAVVSAQYGQGDGGIRFQNAGTAGLSSSGTAITSTVPIYLTDGSNAAPSLARNSATNTGIYMGAGGFYFTASGVLRSQFTDDSRLYLWSDSARIGLGASVDVNLYRDAANTLALRNSTNAQTFNIYNTYTASDNYERASLIWSGNEFNIRTEKGSGGGSNRYLVLGTAGAGRWQITAAGLLEPTGNDTYDIGENGVAVKSLFVLRSIQGSKSKTLTDNTATAFVRLTVADDDYEGCNVIWTAYAEDADTDARQVRQGNNHVAILNNSGTESCVVSTGDSAVNVTAGTFTCTFDCAAGTNTVDLRATCDTSLDAAAETLTIEYRLDCPSPIATITPQ